MPDLDLKGKLALQCLTPIVNRREEIIDVIKRVYFHLQTKNIPVFHVSKSNLKQYHAKRKDVEAGYAESKNPPEHMQSKDEDLFDLNPTSKEEGMLTVQFAGKKGEKVDLYTVIE